MRRAHGEMAVVENILAHARAEPDRLALSGNGRRLTYGAFAAAILAARRRLARQAVSAERMAILCIGDIVETWIVGLALRSLGVTTVTARARRSGRWASGPSAW